MQCNNFWALSCKIHCLCSVSMFIYGAYCFQILEFWIQRLSTEETFHTWWAFQGKTELTNAVKFAISLPNYSFLHSLFTRLQLRHYHIKFVNTLRLPTKTIDNIISNHQSCSFSSCLHISQHTPLINVGIISFHTGVAPTSIKTSRNIDHVCNTTVKQITVFEISILQICIYVGWINELISPQNECT